MSATLAVLLYVIAVFYAYSNFPNFISNNSNIFPIIALLAYYLVSVMVVSIRGAAA